MSNNILKTLFEDWMIVNERVFTEKFTYDNLELYMYYDMSAVINPNLIGGTVSFKPLALVIKKINLENDDYFLLFFDKSVDAEKVVKDFVLKVLV